MSGITDDQLTKLADLVAERLKPHLFSDKQKWRQPYRRDGPDQKEGPRRPWRRDHKKETVTHDVPAQP